MSDEREDALRRAVGSGLGFDDAAQTEAACRWAVAEIDRLRRRVQHTEQWYGSRWKRMADELRGSEVWERVACIMANGTAEVTEPPTYDQQMNLLRHEVARLRKALDV